MTYNSGSDLSVHQDPSQCGTDPYLLPVRPEKCCGYKGCLLVSTFLYLDDSGVLAAGGQVRGKIRRMLCQRVRWGLLERLYGRIHGPWGADLIHLYIRILLPEPVPGYRVEGSLGRRSESVHLSVRSHLPTSCLNNYVCYNLLRGRPVCNLSLSGFLFMLFQISVREKASL